MSVSSSDSEDSPAIVFDLGTRHCRAGFAGDDAPRSIFPNIVGTPKLEDQATLISYKDAFVGDAAQDKRDLLSIRYPMQRGIVTDWDAMTRIWNHVFFNELKTDPESCSVLMSEAPLNPKGNREMMTQIMFEQFNTQGFYVSLDPLLALYAAGRGRGVVISCGEGTTHCLPLYESYLMRDAIKRIDFSGTDLTQGLSDLLIKRGYNLCTTSSLEIVRTMKEKLCYCASDFAAEVAKAEMTSDMKNSYELPDGQKITMDKERFQIPEAMFNPSLLGRKDCPGLTQLVHDCFKDLDRDVFGDLLVNLVLSGGSTCIQGLPERLNSELSAIFPRMKVRVISYPERKLSTWIGGSIISSLTTFQSWWITKSDYEENGPDIVNRKCP